MSFEDELERNNYIEAVASLYKVSPDSLKKLVAKTAIQDGLATPAIRYKKTEGRTVKKEDGTLTSQKVLLTWLIDMPELFDQIKPYISPGDFTEELYRTVAEILYEQLEKGDLNPAQIIDHFTEEEEHHEVASLFNTRIQKLSTKEEKEMALKEVVIRVKNNSIDQQMAELNPADVVGFQKLLEERGKLQSPIILHISF